MSLTTIRRRGHARACTLLLALVTPLAMAATQDRATTVAVSEPSFAPSALLAVDQHRATVVERIVSEWGDRLVAAGAGINREQLREMLFTMRADLLLAASLAGSLDGLRDVVVQAPVVAKGVAAAKSLGDPGTDVVYVPVTPCRLVDTRAPYPAVYQNAGPFAAGEIRTYTVQGGNGVCLAQLPAGLTPAAVQLQVFGIPANGVSGDIEVLAQGAIFGSSATLVFIGDTPFTSAGTTARINQANNQISVQVRSSIANVAMDVVGYFQRPTNYGGTHVVTGEYATDGGGFSNTASGNTSTVGGGEGNTGSGGYSTVGGGRINTASGDYASVAGGLQNAASGVYSTVGGGRINTASGDNSTVAGGGQNTASGVYSTVVGGVSNTAIGISSFAGGQRASANFDGCFVWGDFSTTNEVGCDAPNRFVARALNGIFMITGGSTQPTYTGAVLPPGATAWIALSDRTSKNNVEPVDTQVILRKVNELPIATWNWNSQDTSIRHMGPMAQDFHVAFGLGETPRGISTIDADGVALAAIQGLNSKVEERLAARDAEIGTLKQELAELRRAVEVLMARTSAEGSVAQAR